VSDLWSYLQDRLSRLMHDPDYVPQAKPASLSLGPLAEPEEGTPEEVVVDEPVAYVSDEPPPIVVTNDYQGPDRRSGEDRRDFTRPQHYGPSDKRVQGFGRRATDRAPAFGRAANPNGLYKQ
jgi:hypothetical protein